MLGTEQPSWFSCHSKYDWGFLSVLEEELQVGTPSRKLSSWNPNIFITKTRNCLYLYGLCSFPNEYILFCCSGDWTCFSSHCDTLVWKPEGPCEALATATFHINNLCVWSTNKNCGVWRGYSLYTNCKLVVIIEWGMGGEARILGCLVRVKGKEIKRKGAEIYTGLNK